MTWSYVGESGGEIQCISTPSYVEKRHRPDATSWIWYFEEGDSEKHWIPFEVLIAVDNYYL